MDGQGEEDGQDASGQTTASSMACWSAQETPPRPGLPNSSRVAVTVADSGFHSATTPSQPGMVAVGAMALLRKPIGQTRTCTAATASGFLTTRPR